MSEPEALLRPNAAPLGETGHRRGARPLTSPRPRRRRSQAGRLATITSDPPPPERGITIADVYVRPDGARLAALTEALSEGLLLAPNR
jgi:hypothetical protein